MGTLMAHAYRHPETVMGIILGTGTNAGNKKKVEERRIKITLACSLL